MGSSLREVTDRELCLLKTLIVLVAQIEISDAVDKHGHKLVNLQAVRDAKALITEVWPLNDPAQS